MLIANSRIDWVGGDVIAGWPYPALSGVVIAEQYDHTNGHTLTPEREWWLVEVPVIRVGVPLLPLWPGFAINTVFYAAILWMLFASPFAMRRHRRIKRGLCPACAYPVGTSDKCSECGKPVRLPLPLGEGRGEGGGGP